MNAATACRVACAAAASSLLLLTAGAQASPTFTRAQADTRPPETTIVDGPPDGAVLNYNTPAYSWASDEEGTFTCRFDNAPISCTLIFSVALSEGPHSFSVAAVDNAGNVDPTPAGRSFTIASAPAPNAPGCLVDGNQDIGTSGNDVRTGGPLIDILFGGGGADLLRGLGGRDCLYGELGNDNLQGGPGSDVVDGGPGNDRLAGGSGNDTLNGGSGTDRLSDGSGRDTFSAGPGNDTVTARDATAFGRRVSDKVSCGAGRFDVAIVDRRDSVNRDCERVRRR